MAREKREIIRKLAMALSSSILEKHSSACGQAHRGCSPSSCHLATLPPLRTGKSLLHSSQTQFYPRLHVQVSDKGNP